MTYNQVKDRLFQVAEKLVGAVRAETARSLSAVQAKLQEEAFNLVVLGQFKRG